MNDYASLEKWKDGNIFRHLFDNTSLNHFHDVVMKKVFQIAVNKVGAPPCLFSWFVMGSAGRFEQGNYSDQDHGFVYEYADEASVAYFQKLGVELAVGLNAVGYPFCDGKVMSSNPLWCKSLKEWKTQIHHWIEEESWESIRNLAIFFDARVLVGEMEDVNRLKNILFIEQKNSPKLLDRFLDNILYVKHSVGLFGNIFVETKGEHEGALDLKYSAFLPYVNAIRYLAMKEEVLLTSTLSRMEALCKKTIYQDELPPFETYFKKLLFYRIAFMTQVKNYEDIHYLNIKDLSPTNRKEIRDILRNGKKLHQFVHKISK